MYFEMQSGTTESVTLSEPGEVMSFECEIMTWAHASVFVFDHPWFAVSDDGGAFTIENVPVGNHRIKAHHDIFGESVVDVSVASGRTTEVVLRLHPK